MKQSWKKKSDDSRSNRPISRKMFKMWLALSIWPQMAMAVIPKYEKIKKSFTMWGQPDKFAFEIETKDFLQYKVAV